MAADLPSPAPPPVYLPPVPIFTWTGIYVGGQIGYAWTTDLAANRSLNIGGRVGRQSRAVSKERRSGIFQAGTIDRTFEA